MLVSVPTDAGVFLSTPSARRATVKLLRRLFPQATFLSTPSARRATSVVGKFGNASIISIHALREEGDKQIDSVAKQCKDFYPRPPRGGRPIWGYHGIILISISIHALREEGDTIWGTHLQVFSDFYPRPPRGGRPGLSQEQEGYQRISIHALREEGDSLVWALRFRPLQFLSTPSARRATSVVFLMRQNHFDFYPRPPRGGRLSRTS